MRALIWHVDSFVCRITEKGRSPIVEPMGERETRVGEALLVLTSVERSDERIPHVIARRAAMILAEHARKLKVNTIVLHSFAHLFAELAKPEIAVGVLQETAEQLRAQGFAVTRPPFGWFNELEIKAKGHPLSRLARTISGED